MLFEKIEYKERLKKVKEAMQKNGIDLLVAHDPANMNYLTGYDAWSFYYAQCVLVHINEEEPICFLRAQDAGGGHIKTYLQSKNIIAYGMTGSRSSCFGIFKNLSDINASLKYFNTKHFIWFGKKKNYSVNRVGCCKVLENKF